MKFFIAGLFFLYSSSIYGQYYYNDIVGTLETNRQMQTYLTNKVKTVTADGYTPQGSKATDFSESQEVKENGRALKVVTITNFNRTANYNRFDEQGRVISIIDSSLGVGNTTTYEYDNAGRIITVQNTVKDPESEIDQVELHKWIYNNNGKVERMWRIVNGSDSLEIRFNPDEKGNPGEEISYRKGKETDRLYYYFDDQGRITDIVRFDDKIKKLVPDNIITYDDAGRVIQVISSSNQKDNVGMGKIGKAYFVRYVIWRYVYNEKGLKSAEALFNSEQEMTGRIKYNYTFTQ